MSDIYGRAIWGNRNKQLFIVIRIRKFVAFEIIRKNVRLHVDTRNDRELYIRRGHSVRR